MKELLVTNQFKKDFKRIRRQNKNMAKLDAVIELLLRDADLPSKYRDHQLKGKFKGLRELHVEPDWLLVYNVTAKEVILSRTGSHSELLGL
tara:strand:- start:804 stop:1076 length:273 start_codon:yes stop_codon:yes gene_type:complete